jgi:hypothetical protein
MPRALNGRWHVLARARPHHANLVDRVRTGGEKGEEKAHYFFGGALGAGCFFGAGGVAVCGATNIGPHTAETCDEFTAHTTCWPSMSSLAVCVCSSPASVSSGVHWSLGFSRATRSQMRLRGGSGLTSAGLSGAASALSRTESFEQAAETKANR